MNGFEITCMVVGIILIFNDSALKNANKKEFIIYCIYNLLRIVIAACMIMLPLYFNFWRK